MLLDVDDDDDDKNNDDDDDEKENRKTTATAYDSYMNPEPGFRAGPGDSFDAA